MSFYTSILLATPGITPREGASPAEIAEVEKTLGFELPTDYRDFLRECDGLEGPLGPHGYLVMWSTCELPGRSTAAQAGGPTAGLVLVGTDGGDAGYGFTRTRDGVQYVQVGLGEASPEAALPLGSTLSEFIRNLTAQSR